MVDVNAKSPIGRAHERFIGVYSDDEFSIRITAFMSKMFIGFGYGDWFYDLKPHEQDAEIDYFMEHLESSPEFLEYFAELEEREREAELNAEEEQEVDDE